MTTDPRRWMNRSTYRELHRFERIALRMAQELVIDQMTYGTCFQFCDETGIYNVPPAEVIIRDGQPEWRRPS